MHEIMCPLLRASSNEVKDKLSSRFTKARNPMLISILAHLLATTETDPSLLFQGDMDKGKTILASTPTFTHQPHHVPPLATAWVLLYSPIEICDCYERRTRIMSNLRPLGRPDCSAGRRARGNDPQRPCPARYRQREASGGEGDSSGPGSCSIAASTSHWKSRQATA